VTTLTGIIRGDPRLERGGATEYAFAVLKSSDGRVYQLTYLDEVTEIALRMHDGDSVRVTGILREGTSVTAAAGFSGEMAPEETEFAPPAAASPRI
jgi:hypothetical protein